MNIFLSSYLKSIPGWKKKKKNDAKERKKWRKRKKKNTQIFVWVIRVHYCRNYKHLSKNYHASFCFARPLHHLVCKIVNDKSQLKYAKIVRKSKWNQIYRFRSPCHFWTKFQNSSHSAGQACERKNRGPNSLQCWNAVYLWFCSLATSQYPAAAGFLGRELTKSNFFFLAAYNKCEYWNCFSNI